MTENSPQSLKISIDLEDTLEDNKAPFIDFFNKFLERNHKAVFEYIGEQKEDDLDGWGFGNLREIMSDARSWDSTDHDVFDIFMHGEQYWLREEDIEEIKSEYGSIWPGFHMVMNNIFRGRPEEFPIYDENTREYIEKLRNSLDQADVDYQVDLVTSRADNEAIHKRPDNPDYNATRGLEEGIIEYLEIHSLDDVLDNVVIAGDKTGHSNDYRIFFDDKPTLPNELGDGQYQVMLDTISNEDLQEPTDFEEIKDGEHDLGSFNVVRVYSVEEGFEAIKHLAEELEDGSYVD